MKRTILLITIMTTTLLLLPMALFAAPKDYLASEGCSYGLAISQEAQAEAIKARAGRLLRYQAEIDRMGLESPGLQIATNAPISNNTANGAVAVDMVGGGPSRIVVGGQATDPMPGGEDAIGGSTGVGGAGLPPLSGDGRFGPDITPVAPSGAGEVIIVGEPLVPPPNVPAEPRIVPVRGEGGGGGRMPMRLNEE